MQTETGVWEVTYNAENRPVRWEQGETVIEMAVDRLGRRVWMRAREDDTVIKEERFVYDGYLCVQRLDAMQGNAVRTEFVWDPTEPVATRPLAPLALSCRLHVLTEAGTYWTLDAARTYPTADPNTVREALREYYEAWPRPAEPFVPDTPTTLAFVQKYEFSPDSLPAIDPAWIRLTLEGECLTLTLANPSETPLTVEAGKFFLWETDDVFRLDGRLVRSPSFDATGDPLGLPQLTLGPGESKTFRWHVAGLAPGRRDRLLYVETPILVDGEPACIFHTEIPLLDLSGAPLFFDPLPPDNCELLQERERVGP